MTSSILLSLCVLVASATATLTTLNPCPNNFFYDALYDLEGGTVCPSPHVSVHEPLVFSNGLGCQTRGTLKISLASALEDAGRRGVLVDLFFTDPSGWSFNLGDSPTNNGYAGDSGTNSYDAEIHPIGNTGLAIYQNDKGRLANVPDFRTSNVFSSRLTLIVQDGAVQWVSDSSLDYLKGTGLFGLNGQLDDDEAGNVPNYDLYLGLNKVVRGFSRTGSGLCKAAIKFLCESEIEEIQATKKPPVRVEALEEILKGKARY